jgi:hypothetical protein
MATRSTETREPRSLADWLRAGTDDTLAALLRRRPDLLHPVPPDLSVLVSRASDRPSVYAALERLDTWTLEVLAQLATSPTIEYDEVRDALGAPEPALRHAVDHLRAAGLVWGEDQALHVVRTAGDLVGPPPAEIHPEPPPLDAVAGDPHRGDQVAATHAAAFVDAVEELLEGWVVDPAPVLRSGGLGVRELRRAAARLDRPDHEAAMLIETAHAAGLLAALRYEDWLPTTAYDAWREQPTATRWLRLAAGWLDSPRLPGLVGARDERGKVVTVLGGELARSPAVSWRRMTVDALADLPAGTSASAESMVASLRWRSPRRGGQFRDEVARWSLREAEQLGITGGGAVGGHGRKLLAGDGPGAVTSLTGLLPAPIDHVLVQADLTAVAPGPLTRDLARELALVADIESRGQASVYRFTESSVRRALDAGRTASDLHDLLARHSRTPVPQPLSYLIDDMARRHGRIRVGTASAYIRCDDPAVVGELLAARAASGLRLRRLATNVLAADGSPDEVLTVLRQLGHAPALESAAGDVVVRRAAVRRAPAPPPNTRPKQSEPMPASDSMIAAAVRMLRAGDRAATVTRRPLDNAEPPSAVMPSTPQAATLTALRAAARDGIALWLGYVNAQGIASQRIVEPMSVEGGYLRAFDHLRDEVRTFAVHRITGVAEFVDGDA